MTIRNAIVENMYIPMYIQNIPNVAQNNLDGFYKFYCTTLKIDFKQVTAIIKCQIMLICWKLW